jgi:hypothetical protein
MAGENKPALVAVRDKREEIIAWLTEAFASDALDVDEFDERVTLAHRAENIVALEKLVEDLEPVDVASDKTESTALVRRSDPSLAINRPKNRRVTSLMGGFERKGSWKVPAKLTVTTVMGGGELDFRETPLPPGETEVKIRAVMGGVKIIVPPDIAVDCEGTGIMGAFENLDRSATTPDPDTPLLHIHGWALMGGVEIETRLPGESGRQARKRKKKERKRLRAEAQKRLKDDEQKRLTD